MIISYQTYVTLVFLPGFDREILKKIAVITRTYPRVVRGLFLYLLSLMHGNGKGTEEMGFKLSWKDKMTYTVVEEQWNLPRMNLYPVWFIGLLGCDIQGHLTLYFDTIYCHGRIVLICDYVILACPPIFKAFLTVRAGTAYWEMKMRNV